MDREWIYRPGLWLFAASACGVAAKISPINFIFVLPILIALRGSWTRTFFMLAAVSATWILTPTDRLEPIRERRQFAGVVDVVWMPRGAKQSDWFVVRTFDGKHFITSFRNSKDISLGDRIDIEGTLSPLNEASERIWLDRRVTGSLRVTRLISTISRGNPFWFLGLHGRQSFVDFVDRTVRNKDAEACIDGICFNVDSQMPAEMLDDLRRSGTIHIISASGLHVVLLVFILSRLFVLLPIPRTAQIALLCTLLLAYVAATGMRAPAVRAAVMGVVPLVAYMFDREGDMLSALGLAGIFFLLLDPLSAIDVSFQLSFVIIGALIMFAPMREEPPSNAIARMRFAATMSMKASLVASISAAPLTAYHFGSISLVSVFANLLVVPPVEMLMIVALIAWPLSMFLPLLSQLLMTLIVEPLAGWVIACAHFFSSLPFAAVYVLPFNAYWVAVTYILGFLAWKVHPRTYPFGAAR